MATNLWFDLKYAWRLLFKTPVYSLLCIAVVAISVGLAMFCYVMDYNIAFKPLPFPGSDRWYSLQVADKAASSANPSIDAYTYQEMVRQTRSVKYLGAFESGAAVLSVGQASTSVRTTHIAPQLLAATAVAPLFGRLFGSNDSANGATPTAVLSYATWQGLFAADPSIVGRQVRIDGQPVQVIGVLPKDFLAFQDFELWLPLQLPVLSKPEASTRKLSPVVVLGPDQSVDSLVNEMQPALAQVNHNYPQLFDSGRHVELFPAYRMWSHDDMPIMAVSLAIAGAVLLLGAVNISVVFFARFLERSHELALRTALGSSRARLLRQCLLESVVVMVLGLVLAMILAGLGVRWGQGLDDLHQQVQATGRALSYPSIRALDVVTAVGVTVVLWLLSTLLPAWRIANQDAALRLSGTGKGVAAAGSTRSASLLVGLQVIVASLVMVICVNLVFAVREEASKPMGVNSSGVMLSTYPTVFSDRYAQPSQRIRYWDDLSAAVRSRSPQSEVAYATAAPTDPDAIPAAIEHQEGGVDQGTLKLPFVSVSHNYFQMLGIRLISGRLFDATDNTDSMAVAVIDKDTATRYWGQQDVIGKRVQVNPGQGGTWLTIVGVVASVSRPYSSYTGVIYRPLRQAAPGEFLLLVKSNGARADRGQLREAAFAVDPELPLRNLQTLDDYLQVLNLSNTALVPPFTAITLGTLLLATSGLFGLISRSVIRRTQEIGVRRALGGTPWRVTTVLLRPAMWYLVVALVGVGVGIIFANFLGDAIPNIFVHGVLGTFAVFTILALVIFIAAYAPTRRVVAMDLSQALRYE